MYRYILWDLDGTITLPEEGIFNSIEYAAQKFGFAKPPRKSLRPFIGPPLRQSFCSYFNVGESDGDKLVEYYREYYAVKGIFECTIYDGIPEVLATLKQRGKIIALATSKPQQYAKRILEHFDLIKYFDVLCGADMTCEGADKTKIITQALLSCQTLADKANKPTPIPEELAGNNVEISERNTTTPAYGVAAATTGEHNNDFVISTSQTQAVVNHPQTTPDGVTIATPASGTATGEQAYGVAAALTDTPANGTATATTGERLDIKGEAVMIGDRLHDLLGAKANGIPAIGVAYGYGTRQELTAHSPTHLAETPISLLAILL